jgi:hypothetical protein
MIVSDLQTLTTSEIKLLQQKKKMVEKWIKRYEEVENIQIGHIIREL